MEKQQNLSFKIEPGAYELTSKIVRIPDVTGIEKRMLFEGSLSPIFYFN
jgi:hypothetical protein